MILNNEIQKGYFLYVTHENCPFVDIADVLNVTDKAIEVQIQHNSKKVWLPKKSLKCLNKLENVFTVEQWFKKMIIKQNNTYTQKALNLLH